MNLTTYQPVARRDKNYTDEMSVIREYLGYNPIFCNLVTDLESTAIRVCMTQASCSDTLRIFDADLAVPISLCKWTQFVKEKHNRNIKEESRIKIEEIFNIDETEICEYIIKELPERGIKRTLTDTKDRNKRRFYEKKFLIDDLTKAIGTKDSKEVKCTSYWNLKEYDATMIRMVFVNLLLSNLEYKIAIKEKDIFSKAYITFGKMFIANNLDEVKQYINSAFEQIPTRYFRRMYNDIELQQMILEFSVKGLDVKRELKLD